MGKGDFPGKTGRQAWIWPQPVRPARLGQAGYRATRGRQPDLREPARIGKVRLAKVLAKVRPVKLGLGAKFMMSVGLRRV
jgi:hypothetical protein